MFDAGVDPLDHVLAAVRSLVAGFEVDGLDAPEAARVVERCAEAERLLAACGCRRRLDPTSDEPVPAPSGHSVGKPPRRSPRGVPHRGDSAVKNANSLACRALTQLAFLTAGMAR